jgi:hypothetical protein
MAGNRFNGIVRRGVPLQQLQLIGCRLLDGEEGLAAALALLPGLQHLHIAVDFMTDILTDIKHSFPMYALPALQQLTHLNLGVLELKGSRTSSSNSRRNDSHVLQPLQALTNLAVLRLSPGQHAALDSDMLAGAGNLTRLEISGAVKLGPGALASLTQLQNLSASIHNSGVIEIGRLLSELPQLLQLTNLGCNLDVGDAGSTPAAAFSALTASSELRIPHVSNCKLPTDVWQHVFPAGRQLLHLRSLNVSKVKQPQGGASLAPEGTCLVGCCPGLRSLNMMQLQYSAERLAPLQNLSGLRKLKLASTQDEGFEAVCQLTRLRELYLQVPSNLEGLLFPLAQLKQLTRLDIRRTVGYSYVDTNLECKVSVTWLVG